MTGNAEGRERPGEAAHAARSPEHGDARAVPMTEDLLAEEGEQHQGAAQRQAETGLDREQCADLRVARDVAHAFAQVLHADQVRDPLAGRARFFLLLEAAFVEADGAVRRQSRHQRRRAEERDRIADEGRVAADQRQRDSAQRRPAGQRDAPERVLQRGGVGEVGFGDQRGIGGGLRRVPEGGNQAVRGDHRVRDPDLIRPAHQQQAENEAGPQQIAGDHDVLARDPVGEHARRGPCDERRHEAGHERDRHRLTRAGQLHQQREESDDVEPVAELRHRVGGEEPAEVAVLAHHREKTTCGEGVGRSVQNCHQVFGFRRSP